jgi:hypothetical protein
MAREEKCNPISVASNSLLLNLGSQFPCRTDEIWQTIRFYHLYCCESFEAYIRHLRNLPFHYVFLFQWFCKTNFHPLSLLHSSWLDLKQCMFHWPSTSHSLFCLKHSNYTACYCCCYYLCIMVIMLLTIRLWSHHVNGQEFLLFVLCLLWKSYFNWRKISLIFVFAPCVNSIKILFIVPTDTHYYKILEMLKHLKLWHLLRHISVHAGTIIREQSCA